MDEKIINISDFKLKNNEQPADRDAMFDVVIWPEIYCIVRNAGLTPLTFHIDETSGTNFLELPITHREPDGSFCSIYYDCCTPDTIYRAECRITFAEDGFFADTALFKVKDYITGNKEWLWFTGESWEQGPGEDFFDIKEILDDYGI